MATESKSNGHSGSQGDEGVVQDVLKVLESYGLSGDRLTQVVAQLGIDAATDDEDEPRHTNGNGHALAIDGIDLSENARVILAQRYLQKDTDGEPVETPEDLFHRVTNAIAAGEAKGARQIWAKRYYDLLTSLKFLPNSPTLVNAGTDGKGCLSACFVVSPEDTIESIMQVANDAAMIESGAAESASASRSCAHETTAFRRLTAWHAAQSP